MHHLVQVVIKMYFCFLETVLHLMIEDALFSLQMYMRPLKQSERREEKKMAAISEWLEGMACRMDGTYDPQTDRPTYIHKLSLIY